MIYLPVKAIIRCSFNVVIATVHPVDALGLDVQCDTSWPAQFTPNDPITVGAVHESPLKAWFSIQRLPVGEEHVPAKEGEMFNLPIFSQVGSLHEARYVHLSTEK